ncbi:hypothetical protein RchiOBHm_Chr2g0139191 [Rosa chinensis]|uniref:RNase H type-1 domain-containing protein n=1 Tax=Rosa chinensis TaxID=74649 RepID=A0A2P6RX21_ROSCH|nr:hypothetical protein RchiOBHm_Chr2g0139191 [Rosa chinensis]
MCCTIGYAEAPEVIEALASRAAVQYAMEYGLAPVSFETVYLKLVNSLLADGDDLSGFGTTVGDIVFLKESIPCSSFVHCYREANSVAHRLASLALNSDLDLVWQGLVPVAISSVVAAPCIN